MRELTLKVGGWSKRFVVSKGKPTHADKTLRNVRRPRRPGKYGDRVDAAQARFRGMIVVNMQPSIFEYGADTHLRPTFDEFGIEHEYDCFAQHLLESALRAPDRPHVLARIGAGDYTEPTWHAARRMREFGLDDKCTIECLDVNADVLERSRAMAAAEGAGDCLRFVQADPNDWRAERLHTGFMTKQPLHRIVNLEQLLSEVRMALHARVPDAAVPRPAHALTGGVT